MKTTSVSAAIAAALLPVLSTANVGIGWSVENVPDSGLKDITFPMSMAKAPHKEGIYFAQQFGFNGIDDIGYTGLQPQDDQDDGTSIVHAVFSSFVEDTTSDDDAHCHEGADGGPGVSCAIDIPATYDHEYNLVIKNTEGTSWTGTLVDTVSGNSTQIGAWTLPSESGGISGSYLGFIEFFTFNPDEQTCQDLLYTDVTFGPPSTETSGAGPGKLDEPAPYGDCEDDCNFSTNEADGGKYEVTVGFKK